MLCTWSPIKVTIFSGVLTLDMMNVCERDPGKPSSKTRAFEFVWLTRYKLRRVNVNKLLSFNLHYILALPSVGILQVISLLAMKFAVIMFSDTTGVS